ncbi:protein-glutamate O-methyltransferase CheR [Pseudanabaena sp. FACHB-2040]|uniref:CheR family methyltransferase n=1 Tax=Pseudanabaena sp. FACHB-2040 TaxID=2692859 RepID=UPI001682155E|nr:protein-glutamate O-methyltransferase CheR [Pseudanabaena sp. FACHB-2040]MBD2260315.1 protein-glutamate O-methyltransferase CheR [Pseudanabaena sp. FACHB-2040]
MVLEKSVLGPEDVEVRLLVDRVYQLYGYDFRNYAAASLKRRVRNFLRTEGLSSISELQRSVLQDRACVERLLLGLTVNTTAMFRDPSFYVAFREQVVPILRTYPFIRIWHAGCSTGQEVYSMAILLQEAGIYHRCRIYATDTNEQVLQAARNGIYPQSQMQEYTQLYLKAGGSRSFSEYYTASHGSAILRPTLRQHIVFGMHNLVTDGSFNEFNVILCRNVLIYFNQGLQNQVHKLFYNSLCKFGILGLGKQETLRFTAYEHQYEPLVRAEKLYRRRD